MTVNSLAGTFECSGRLGCNRLKRFRRERNTYNTGIMTETDSDTKRNTKTDADAIKNTQTARETETQTPPQAQQETQIETDRDAATRRETRREADGRMGRQSLPAFGCRDSSSRAVE